jgi:N-methylhydantoinase A/oxoprolinase/acetone carboxylase beta subunit
MVLARRPRSQLPEAEQEILDRLAAGPRSMAQLAERSVSERSRIGSLVRRRVIDLEQRGLVRRAGFTPTDALHVLGSFQRWDAEAARLGAALLAGHARRDAVALCREVAQRFSERVATELVAKILEDEDVRPDWEREPVAVALLRRALENDMAGAAESDLACSLSLRRPLVAVGAPVAAYLPHVARILHTELVIPPHAEVANAVGAVSGSIVLRVQALISPLDGEGRVRLHLPDGVRDFAGVESAVEYAQKILPAFVMEQARQAGADQVEVRMARVDHVAAAKVGMQFEIYLGSDLSFTAAGRPSPARR